MSYIKICDLDEDVLGRSVSLWRCGSGKSLGLALSFGEDMLELPVVELRAALMDDLLYDGVIPQLWEMGGHEMMVVLFEAAEKIAREKPAKIRSFGSRVGTIEPESPSPEICWCGRIHDEGISKARTDDEVDPEDIERRERESTPY